MQSSTLLTQHKPVTSACLTGAYLYQGTCRRYVARAYNGFVYLESCTQQENGLPKLGKNVLCCQDRGYSRRNAPIFCAKLPAASLLLLWFKLATDGTLSYSKLLGERFAPQFVWSGNHTHHSRLGCHAKISELGRPGRQPHIQLST